MLYLLRRYGVLSELGTSHLDNDERGIILFRLKLQSELDTLEYLTRPTWFLDGAPGFNMVGATGRRTSRQDQLISLPMYAKYARLRLRQIPMNRLLIKLREPGNKDHIKFLKDAITNNLDRTGLKDKFEIWSYQDMIATSSDAASTLEAIFNVVIVITMFICYFSLSSSMTGNLYEQCKDIAIMRAMGMHKGMITKLYIYEAFILVVASSFSGVVIGTCVGYSISY